MLGAGVLGTGVLGVWILIFFQKLDRSQRLLNWKIKSKLFFLNRTSWRKCRCWRRLKSCGNILRSQRTQMIFSSVTLSSQSRVFDDDLFDGKHLVFLKNFYPLAILYLLSLLHLLELANQIFFMWAQALCLRLMFNDTGQESCCLIICLLRFIFRRSSTLVNGCK